MEVEVSGGPRLHVEESEADGGLDEWAGCLGLLTGAGSTRCSRPAAGSWRSSLSRPPDLQHHRSPACRSAGIPIRHVAPLSATAEDYCLLPR